VLGVTAVLVIGIKESARFNAVIVFVKDHQIVQGLSGCLPFASPPRPKRLAMVSSPLSAGCARLQIHLVRSRGSSFATLRAPEPDYGMGRRIPHTASDLTPTLSRRRRRRERANDLHGSFAQQR
jgi:hypothetical protein